MILKYSFSDNILEKDDPTYFPNLLQDNVKLEFSKTDELPNSKYYADIKTVDAVKRVRLRKYNGVYSCELPKWVTHYPFFKLLVHTFNDGNHFTTNELIIPVRCLDYLDFNRTVAHAFKHHKRDGCYKDWFDDKFSNRYHPHHIFRHLTEEDLEAIDSEYLKFLIQYKFSVNELAIIFNTDVKSVKDKLEEVGVYY